MYKLWFEGHTEDRNLIPMCHSYAVRLTSCTCQSSAFHSPYTLAPPDFANKFSLLPDLNKYFMLYKFLKIFTRQI